MLHSWWRTIEHFSAGEFTYPGWMEEDFVKTLDSFRAEVGSMAIITSSNDPEQSHAPNSEHYNNRAVDLVFPQTGKTLLDILFVGMRYFNGIGLYPYWKYKGLVVGGFHVELVPNRKRMKQWLAIPFESGNNDYRALNEKELKLAGVI